MEIGDESTQDIGGGKGERSEEENSRHCALFPGMGRPRLLFSVLFSDQKCISLGSGLTYFRLVGLSRVIAD